MNNLLSYCGLIDEKIRASDKDLPVIKTEKIVRNFMLKQYMSHGCETNLTKKAINGI